ncbi:FecR family protein [Leptospira sp. 2 VSF19]|uniref:FecR family protein n=1 Tax=Leptospira soteropolitanensis TaxID=2950025 RepID=A0AAW5VKK6_9LEPT|nr:FecR domain-containing protein [Leptospira soteropolitanensis]MCW7492061.1 FecR family protein [Leptospira soteropolitanensis]MCW7499643.1 FecR family protein [Leptospira soteropolitanensis]MCW7521894.1 FecR family protein [Leptospira soteropolitanensis]MCW7525748.1 FecR family protein [Leptospira soteropolitanensis]MCW7530138.1 FecR family protein [Leptospira soteropolitanensis]
MRWLNDTRFVVSALLLLILVFSYFLYRNLNDRFIDSSSPTIGVITFKNKTVLRKYNDAVVWDLIESKTEVKNRDTIRTEGLSDAILTLNDGTKINISENSMILLDISDKNININFAYGSFEAAREGTVSGDMKMNILAGDKTVQVASGDVKLDKTKSELNIKVDQGEAKLTSNGKEETIAKDQIANVTESGVKVGKPVYRLSLPEDRRNILSESGQEKVQFSISGWKSDSAKTSNPVIEISLFPDFSKSLYKEKLTAASISKKLASGSYYWRVTYDDPSTKAKQTTEVFQFRVLNDPGLKMMSPKAGEVFAYTQELPVVRFVWNPLDLYSSYTVIIAKDSNFSDGLVSKQTQNQSLAFDSLKEGSYFAKIQARSNLQGIPEKTSNVVGFQISKKNNLSPPELLEPVRGKVFAYEQTKSQLFFSWKDEKDFSSYEWELSSDSNFQTKLKVESTKNNFLKLSTDLNLGVYFWRVKGLTSNGLSFDSKPNTFTVIAKEEIELVAPANGAEVEVDERSAVILKWKKITNKSNYEIEIARDSDFKPLITKETVSGNYFEFKSKDFGRFYWRVKPVDGDNDYSAVRNFQMQTNREPPNLLSPLRNETIDLFSKSSILFTWKAVEKASGYRIQLFDISGVREKQILNEKTSSTKLTYNDIQKFNVGRFRWEVASIYKQADGTEKESAYNKQDFFISVPELRIPKILTPGKIYVE